METAATGEPKGHEGGGRRQSTPVSPRTTPSTSTGSGPKGDDYFVLTPSEKEPETAASTSQQQPRRQSVTTQDQHQLRRQSAASQHSNWRQPLPPEQEQARRPSLSYQHRRQSSLSQHPLHQPSFPQQHQDQEDPSTTPYRPPLHLLTTPLSLWPATAAPYPVSPYPPPQHPTPFLPHPPPPYPFTPLSIPTPGAPTPYPSISVPTPLPYNPLTTPISPGGIPDIPTTPLVPAPGLGLPALQTEQSYLLHALQQQHERATRLVARYVALTGTGPGAAGDGWGGEAGMSRKVRKEAASLRARIDEAARQEKMVVLRLGEVWCEVRGRERWAGVVGGVDGRVGSVGGAVGGGGTGSVGGGRVGSTGNGRVGSVGGGRTGSTGGGAGKRGSAGKGEGEDKKRGSFAALSPLVAEFVPSGGKAVGGEERTGGVVFAEDIWGADGGGGGDRAGKEVGPTSECAREEDCGGLGGGDGIVVELDDLLWEFESDVACGKDKNTDDAGEGPSDKEAQRGRRISVHHAPPSSFKAARDKRMSLPSLKTIWPRSYTVPKVKGKDEEEDGGFI